MAVGLAVALTLAACSDAGTENETGFADPAGTPALVGIEIIAESTTIAAGESAQLEVIGHYEDSSSTEITGSVRFSSSNPSAIRVGRSGFVEALAAGSSSISARHDNGAFDRLTLVATDAAPAGPPAIGSTLSDEDWNETAVRKVLHVFAYGGQATDAQISVWADMPASEAISEMLSFEPFNRKLAPSDAGRLPHRLAELQARLEGITGPSPMPEERRRFYSTLNTDAFGNATNVSERNLQRAWVHAVTSGSSNPFLHKTAFLLSNYQMALRSSIATPGLTRAYYDQIVSDLASGSTMTQIITNAARSAAISNRYGHRLNRIDPATRSFLGNDDFAREYFQLFFRLLGDTEPAIYHEGTTIENNAMLLTGFKVDRAPNAYGSAAHRDQLIAPISFHDHVDLTGSSVPNLSWHHYDCLEILHELVCGANGSEKLDALGPVAAQHRETLSNLPVFLIGLFADDDPDEDKKTAIRAAWIEANDDLLSFLRSYASSYAFHAEDTVKFLSSFDRNLALVNHVLSGDEEVYKARDEQDSPIVALDREGVQAFEPIHAVFGHQTGPEASNNAALLKSAIETALDTGRLLTALERHYRADDGTAAVQTWTRDWTALGAPRGTARDASDWLWQRFIVDGGRNMDLVARAQIHALVARGIDFGLVAADELGTPIDAIYSVADIESDPDLLALVAGLGEEPTGLDSSDATVRTEANRRLNLAVSFVSVLPYAFAIEGQ